MAFVGIDVGGTRIKLGLVKQKKIRFYHSTTKFFANHSFAKIHID
jgi:activator of 2-hydroxyglutaryl-CoA dehydratase